MAIYNTGSVKIIVGNNTIVGNGTDFSTYVSAGDLFKLTNDNAWYEITAVNSATNIDLSASYSNSNYGNGVTLTGMSYQVCKDFTPNYSIPEMSEGDSGIRSIFTRSMRNIDSKLADLNASINNVASDMNNLDSNSVTATTLKARSYVEIGNNVYIFSGSKNTQASIESYCGSLAATKAGSLYLSESGSLWRFSDNTTATQE